MFLFLSRICLSRLPSQRTGFLYIYLPVAESSIRTPSLLFLLESHIIPTYSYSTTMAASSEIPIIYVAKKAMSEIKLIDYGINKHHWDRSSFCSTDSLMAYRRLRDRTPPRERASLRDLTSLENIETITTFTALSWTFLELHADANKLSTRFRHCAHLKANLPVVYSWMHEEELQLQWRRNRYGFNQLPPREGHRPSNYLEYDAGQFWDLVIETWLEPLRKELADLITVLENDYESFEEKYKTTLESTEEGDGCTCKEDFLATLVPDDFD